MHRNGSLGPPLAFCVWLALGGSALGAPAAPDGPLPREVQLPPIPAEPAGIAGGTVTLRPVDAATVRVVALGKSTRRDGTITFEWAHGSAVVVDRGGWAITAAHVVEDSQAIVVLLPGQDEPHWAVEVDRIGDRDLALLRFAGAAPTALEVRQGRDIMLGQRVHASGYPLDPRERWPAAAEGQIGRPLNDGRLQLSISLNPGNSGGPVVDDEGALVGVVSRGADPRKGAQGFAIIQPVDPLVPALRAAIAAGGEGPPAEDIAGRIFAEHIGARTTPPLAERVERLRAVRGLPEPGRAALLALEGEAVERALNEQGTAEAKADAVVIAAATGLWLDRAGLPRRRAPTTSAEPPTAPGGVDDGWGSRQVVGYYMRTGLSVVVEQSPRADGSLGGVSAPLEFGARFGTPPDRRARFQGVLGVSGELGFWREGLLVTGLAVAGVRGVFGASQSAGFVEVDYTPGYVNAEERSATTWAGYRLMVGLRSGIYEYALSWSEIGRDADDTLRTVTLSLGGGF